MKKVLLIAIALISINAIAQERGRHNDRNNSPNKGEMFKDMSAEDLATLQTKRMTLDFDLTESQQKAIYDLQLSATNERKQKHEERKKAREDKDFHKPSKDERFALLNESLDKKIAHKNKMKSILNDEQYKKWERSNAPKNIKRKHKKRRSKRSR